MAKLVKKSHFTKALGLTRAAIHNIIKTKMPDSVVDGMIDIEKPSVIRYVSGRVGSMDEFARSVDNIAANTKLGRKRKNPKSDQYDLKEPSPRRAKVIESTKQTETNEIINTEDQIDNQNQDKINEDDQEICPEIIEEKKQDKNKSIIEKNCPDPGEVMDWTINQIVAKWGTEPEFFGWVKAIKELEAILEKKIKNAESMGQLIHKGIIRRGIIEPIEEAHIRLLQDGASTIVVDAISLHKAGEPEEEIVSVVEKHISSFLKRAKDKVKKTLKELRV